VGYLGGYWLGYWPQNFFPQSLQKIFIKDPGRSEWVGERSGGLRRPAGDPIYKASLYSSKMTSHEEIPPEGGSLQESSQEWEVDSYEGDTPVSSESETSSDESSGDEILRPGYRESPTLSQSRLFSGSSWCPYPSKRYKYKSLVQSLDSHREGHGSSKSHRRANHAKGHIDQDVYSEQG